ncbi:hypothetical protein DOS79_03550, partial [Staphylococcus felis]|uniref:rhodanese-like domain-containing protein n=1 Tax=Staphylococcus felis TaxID=46127 RepID=UPI000E365D81
EEHHSAETQYVQAAEAVHSKQRQLVKAEIPIEKEEQLYVQCRSGVRRSNAIGILENKGYTNIKNIKNGYNQN